MQKYHFSLYISFFLLLKSPCILITINLLIVIFNLQSIIGVLTIWTKLIAN